MSFWLRFLGAIVSGLSIFSLVQRYAQQPVIAVVADLLAFYKALTYPIADAVLWMLSYAAIPPIPRDIVVLYFVLAATMGRMFVKTFDADRVLERKRYSEDRPGELPKGFKDTGIFAALILVMCFIFWLPLCVWSIFTVWTSKKFEWPPNAVPEVIRLLLRVWGMELGYVIAAFVVVFLFNALGPSIGL